MSRSIDDLTEAELPTRYMLRDYDESMAGMIIPDHLVTRAPNGRFWKHEENVLLKIHSMDRCPTYGFCDRCCSSGPVGMHCQKCKSRYFKYRVIKRGGKILDATWVSRFFQATHMDALADRQYRWLRTPIMSIGIDLLGLGIGDRYKGVENAPRRAEELWLFQEGIENDVPGPWDVTERRVTQIDPFGEMYNGE